MGTRINLSSHKNKHENELWNATSVFMGLLKGTLKVVSFTVGTTADLLILGGKGVGLLVGVIFSKSRNGKRTVITAFQEKENGYWNNQKKNW